MTQEQVAALILEWSAKVRQMLLLRSMYAKWTAIGFATCIASLSNVLGVPYPDDIKQFLEREGVL